MIVYIVRHAWAEDRDGERFPDDDLRPLTRDGRKRFVRLARRLIDAGMRPQVIATSPLVRCAQTAEILAEQLPRGAQVVPLDALAPGSDLAALIEWSNRQSVDEVAWCGHAPDVGHLAAELVGDGRASLRFAKGSVAAIRFDDVVAAGRGELVWLATAKLLAGG